MTVKDTEFTDSALEDPLQALNKVVTEIQGCEQQPQPVEKVVENVSFSDLQTTMKWDDPSAKISPRPSRMFGKQICL